MKKKKLEIVPQSDVEIIAATIKDELCNYSYEVLQGTGVGDNHSVKGKGIVERDLLDAFSKLNVHFAFIDDAFKNAGTDVVNIDRERNSELANNYVVTGIKVKGQGDGIAVTLYGDKYISTVKGRMKLETPRIVLDALSDYPFNSALVDAVETVREEVRLYKEGKYTIREELEIFDDAQLSIGDTDFEDAKV